MPKKILIADDEATFRFSAGLALRLAGYEISEALDGREALAMVLARQAEKKQFDLLLLDIQMPGLTGIEVFNKLRLQGISIPTLFISGYAGQDILDNLDPTGIFAFLPKPFAPEQLIKQVRSIAR